MPAIIAVLILFAIEGTQYLRHSFSVRYIRKIFWGVIFLIFTNSSFLAIRQFVAWGNDLLPKYFLPPYTSITYFLLYSGFKFFFPYFLSLAVALLFIFWMKAANRKHEGNFFEEDEPYLAGLGIFLSGHPGWMIYLLTVVFCYLIIHLFQRLKGIKNKRVPLYHLWIPAGLFVILINAFWLSRCSWWLSLKL